MANTLKRLAGAAGSAELGTSDAVLYTAPAATKATITNLAVTNTSIATRTVRLHIRPTATPADPSNAHALYDTSLAPGQSVEGLRGLVLEPGEVLSGSASGAGVNVRLSGVEVAP